MGAELSRKRGGKKTRTSMSESQLEEFASKELDTSFIEDEVMEKNVIKGITKYLGKQENGYPPTKGERREAKRTKAKKMKVTGAGAKISQRIIGEKAAAAGGAMGKMDNSSIKGNKVEKNIIKAIEKFLGKQTSEHTAADPEAAKRAASRARQEAGVGKPMPAPYVSTTPDPLTGKKPPKKPKPSWSAVERPEGAQRTSVGGGGSMVAFGKKKAGAVVPEQSLIKAISTYLKEDTPKYNKKAVESAIKRDKSIGKKEAKAIHGLLRGRQKSDS